MFKNYFLLCRHTIESHQDIKDFIVESIFTKEKDKLIFELKKESQKKYIEISTNTSLPYFIIKEKHSRAKKNTLDFFKNYLPAHLASIKIAEFDRIIQFKLNTASIYFYIHGRDTNVLLLDLENNLHSFKKIREKTDLISNLQNLIFTGEFILPKINFEEASPEKILKKNLYLGKEIVSEFKHRMEEEPKKSYESILIGVINDIKHTNPIVSLDVHSDKPIMTFLKKDETSIKELKSFNKVNDALIYYISLIQKQISIGQLQNKSKEVFEKNLVKLENKIDQLKSRLNIGSKEKTYQQIADLLSMNIDEFKHGENAVELVNIYDNNKMIEIKLNENLTPRENIEYYYNKAKSARKEFESLKSLLDKLTEEHQKLKSIVESNEFAENIKIQVNPGKSKNQKRESQKSKFRQFILFNKYSIYVGRNSKNNDELTTGFAKQNDYWFHARSVSGSHVLLRYEKSMGEIQKNILEKAASIAAFYSKAKTSGLVPVSYTQKKYVIKRKGMEPGKVYLLKETVLIVKPEIPKECIPVTEELI